jgi:AcrR family transcriptional regulator
MNMPPASRSYRMTARAESAERTARKIIAAAVTLWHEISLEDVTLEAIAARAGVSVRTAIRRFGSRDGVIEAAIASESARITAERDEVTVDDLEGALETLLRHYERDGDATLRTLALEDRVELARTIAETGRVAHREGCARWFAAYLPVPTDPTYATRLDAFVTATDIYVWKLLRRDLNRSLQETQKVMRLLVHSLMHHENK